MTKDTTEDGREGPPNPGTGGRHFPSVFLGPVRCDGISREDLVSWLTDKRPPAPELFFNVNAHALNLALKTREFAAALNRSSVTFCDGFGVLLLERVFGPGKMRHRMTPPDFVEAVYARLALQNGRVFFLGDEEAVVRQYAKSVGQRYPGLVVGSHHGFFADKAGGEQAVIAQIADARPDLLLIGMGMPRQELWAVEKIRQVNCARILTVGALFAWGRGRRRGPRWATDHGLEWMFRLVHEPGRVWRRYLVGLPEVVLRLAAFQASKRGSSDLR
jgi:N-acetylglucosaminyldiphosphoundecaprenol N-acetyl-beta-D-mannosaminyltransferase